MPSTPASHFHMLRRQIHREFRKPLIVMTPKSLLRHPLARSSLSEFAEGTTFKPVIGEHEDLEAKKVKRLIFCSGKVYYDLIQRRTEKDITNIAIARVEQIAPFPYYAVAEEQARFPNAEIVWVQEESMNMGAWTYVQPRIQTALTVNGLKPHQSIKYIGRRPSGSPAAGKDYVHKKEQEQLVTDAMTLNNGK